MQKKAVSLSSLTIQRGTLIAALYPLIGTLRRLHVGVIVLTIAAPTRCSLMGCLSSSHHDLSRYRHRSPLSIYSRSLISFLTRSGHSRRSLRRSSHLSRSRLSVSVYI